MGGGLSKPKIRCLFSFSEFPSFNRLVRRYLGSKVFMALS